MLSTIESARADLPITYVGRPDIHRFDGTVRQVTLVQPHVEQAKVLENEFLGRGERDPECAIETGTFLKEALSEEAKIGAAHLFRNGRLSLESPPSRSTVVPILIDVNDGEQPKGSPFHGMLLAGN